MATFLAILCLLGFFSGTGGTTKDASCTAPRRCSSYHGPIVKFPFRLKDHHPDHCGYPGFDLRCGTANDTLIQLPLSVNASVVDIDYKSMTIAVEDTQYGCLGWPLQYLNLNGSPFRITYGFDSYGDSYVYSYDNLCSYISSSSYCWGGNDNLTLFNCSSTIGSNYTSLLNPYPCPSGGGHSVYTIPSSTEVQYNHLPEYCTVMYTKSWVPSRIKLSWSEGLCSNCSQQEKGCMLGNNTIVCTEPGSSHKIHLSLIHAGIIVGSLFFVFVAVALYFGINSYNQKQHDQLKIEMFLKDYKALKPTRYSYADIKKITTNFLEKVGQGGYGTVYKGKLSDEIFVAVKVLEDSSGNGEDFVNEVSTIGRIHHVNIVRLVGYCADGIRRALVYEFMPNYSLAKFVSSQRRINSLGWEKLHNISLGIAKGIEYLHQGCDQRILHFDIKPQNILLDLNFNPKISDFGLAKLCSKEQSLVSMTTARGTMGYIAPEVFSRNFGNVSYKSDVYSFGMLLLEIVGATTRKENEGNDDVYFPEWIYKKLEEDDNFGFGIEEEGNDKIARRITIVGLRCIQWYPVDRPSMKVAIQMLEGEGELSVPQNPFGSMTNNGGGATTRGKQYATELEIISEYE